MSTMVHHSRLGKIVIDVPAAVHDRELEFWQGASGHELPPIWSDEYHGDMLRDHDFLMLLVQRLDSGEPRVHIDIHTDDIEAEVARLERLGAERVRQVRTWWVMRDPAGLLFCVLSGPPESFTGENVRRWD